MSGNLEVAPSRAHECPSCERGTMVAEVHTTPALGPSRVWSCTTCLIVLVSQAFRNLPLRGHPDHYGGLLPL